MDLESGHPAHARVEQLLREAHLNKMRGRWAASEALCRQALELAPEDPMALEMLADALAEKGDLTEALNQYRKALELQPQRAVLEEKVARLVLQQAEAEREKLAVQLLLTSPVKAKERKRKAQAALWLSLICPGGGQLLLRENWKAALFFGLAIFGLGVGGADMVKFALGMMTRVPGAPPNGFLAFLGLLGGLAWVASILDAAAQAGKSTEHKQIG